MRGATTPIIYLLVGVIFLASVATAFPDKGGHHHHHGDSSSEEEGNDNEKDQEQEESELNEIVHDDGAHDHGHGHKHKASNSDGKQQANDTAEDHHHHDLHHVSHSLDNLWSRWESMELAMCGPKPGQAHILLHRHNMTQDKGAAWKHSAYLSASTKTGSEIVTAKERSVYTTGYKLLEGSASIPWFRMTKSEVLFFWHKGGNILVHSIKPDGAHEETILGDELLDSHAKYSVRFEPGVWVALELDGADETSYGFMSSVLVPGYSKEFMEKGTEADLVKILSDPHHLDMIKRLLVSNEAHSHHDHPHSQHGHDAHEHVH